MTPDFIFQQIAANIPLTDILPLDTTSSKEHYYYMKAYQLVNKKAFEVYCKNHNYEADGETPRPFHTMLRRILKENYPPLSYCHVDEKAYSEISQFLGIARKYLS